MNFNLFLHCLFFLFFINTINFSFSFFNFCNIHSFTQFLVNNFSGRIVPAPIKLIKKNHLTIHLKKTGEKISQNVIKTFTFFFFFFKILIATKELDSNESQEAPWIKEFRNSRKRVSRIFNNRDPVKPASSDKPSPIETPFTRVAKPLSSLAGDQSSRGVVSGKVTVNVSSSSATEEKKTPTILPEVTASPKYRVERKSSFNAANESGVSSRMKENR